MTLFDPSTQKYITTSYNRNNSSSLSDDFVYDILKDNEGGLWITTYFGGINYSNPNSSNFTIRHCATESARGRIISKFHEDKNGDIFIGTDDGDYLYIIRSKTSAIDIQLINLILIKYSRNLEQ